MPFYFKRRNQRVIEKNILNPETGKKELKTVSEVYFTYIGVVSPFERDYMIMETGKSSESIYHSREEVDRVRAILWRHRITYRLHDAATDELLEPIITNN